MRFEPLGFMTYFFIAGFMIHWFWSNQFPAINSRKGEKICVMSIIRWVEGPMTPRGGWASPVAKDMAHPVLAWHCQEPGAERDEIKLRRKREGQWPQGPVQRSTSSLPAMWAVGLSVCAHHGLGSWVSISGLGYQKTPQDALWLHGMQRDSWGWVWWQDYFCAPSTSFCESSALSYRTKCQCTQVQEILVNSLRGPVDFSVPLPCNFGAQPAVQQQCSCHMLICLMSLSHQKAAREGKCEAELWLHGLSRTGLGCRCESKHNKLGKAVQL